MDIDMRKGLLLSFLFLLCGLVCFGQALPITGTFVNLPYQDVRNLYTNPPHLDNTDPQMWKAKIREMKDMGMEYLVFMSVANEQKAYYPSKLMPWHYPSWRQSPVDAVMEAAAECGMKSRVQSCALDL